MPKVHRFGCTLVLLALFPAGTAPGQPPLRSVTAAEQQALADQEAALAAAMAKQDWPAAAVALERRVAIDEASWGPEHPTTITAIETWALAVQLQGDGPRSEALFRRALGLRVKISGEHASKKKGTMPEQPPQ